MKKAQLAALLLLNSVAASAFEAAMPALSDSAAPVPAAARVVGQAQEKPWYRQLRVEVARDENAWADMWGKRCQRPPAERPNFAKEMAAAVFLPDGAPNGVFELRAVRDGLDPTLAMVEVRFTPQAAPAPRFAYLILPTARGVVFRPVADRPTPPAQRAAPPAQPRLEGIQKAATEDPASFFDCR